MIYKTGTEQFNSYYELKIVWNIIDFDNYLPTINECKFVKTIIKLFAYLFCVLKLNVLCVHQNKILWWFLLVIGLI